jgi:hypothetical protein
MYFLTFISTNIFPVVIWGCRQCTTWKRMEFCIYPTMQLYDYMLHQVHTSLVWRSYHSLIKLGIYYPFGKHNMELLVKVVVQPNPNINLDGSEAIGWNKCAYHFTQATKLALQWNFEVPSYCITIIGGWMDILHKTFIISPTQVLQSQFCNLVDEQHIHHT